MQQHIVITDLVKLINYIFAESFNLLIRSGWISVNNRQGNIVAETSANFNVSQNVSLLACAHNIILLRRCKQCFWIFSETFCFCNKMFPRLLTMVTYWLDFRKWHQVCWPFLSFCMAHAYYRMFAAFVPMKCSLVYAAWKQNILFCFLLICPPKKHYEQQCFLVCHDL